MKSDVLKYIKYLLIFLIVLFFSNISLGWSNDEINIHVKNIIEDYPALKTNLQIPVFEGFSNEIVQVNIRKRVETDVFNFLNKLLEDSEKYLETAKEAGWSPKTYIGETIFELHYLSKEILSFSIVYYSYTLGAHGFTERVSYNFDLESGEKIEIGNLFEGYDYKKFIDEEIKKQIAIEKELYFNNGEDFQSIKEDQTFYIQYDGIVIYFALYEIAPYANGIRYFKIPFNIFRDLTSEHLPYFAIN